MSLESLLEIVGAPEHPLEAGRSDAWADVESVLGTALPQDYKQ